MTVKVFAEDAKLLRRLGEDVHRAHPELRASHANGLRSIIAAVVAGGRGEGQSPK